MPRGLRNFSRRLRRARLLSRTGLVISAIAALFAVVAFGVMFRSVGGHGQTAGFGVTPPREEFPVRGIDISAHNGMVDFEKVAADSVDFIYIKATEGADFKDRAFIDNYRRASRTGVPLGVYHFFRFDAPGRLQAYNLLHSLRGRPVGLPVMIDVEQWSNPKNYSTEAVAKRLVEMVETVETNGYDVILYTNKKGLNTVLQAASMDGGSKRPLWICSFTSPPLPPEKNDRWTLWQHTHRGSVEGVDGNVDINVYRGSRAEWQEWLAKRLKAPQQ